MILVDIRTRLLLPPLWQLDRLLPRPHHPWNQPGDPLENFFWWELEHADRAIGKLASRLSLEEKRVLDVGCGAGGKSVRLAQYGASVVGIDLSEYAVKVGRRLIREHFPELSVRVNLLVGDITSPPDGIGKFDVVFLDDVWEHLAHPTKALVAIHRLLKKDGVVFIAFPPYTHPWGAHVSDLISIPWIQFLLWEKYIVRWYVYKALRTPGGFKRLKFKGINPRDSRIRYINRMTFERTLRTIYDLRRLYQLVWFDMDLLNIPLNRLISKLPRIGKYVVSKYYLMLRKRG